MAILKVTFNPEERFEEVFNRNAGEYAKHFSSKLFSIIKQDLIHSFLEKYCAATTVAHVEAIDKELAKEVKELFHYKQPQVQLPIGVRDPGRSTSKPWIGDPYTLFGKPMY